MVTGILNICHEASIQFHDTLHGFCTGIGIRTDSLEVKLLQQCMAIREEVLYEIFLDIHNSYASLDRER